MVFQSLLYIHEAVPGTFSIYVFPSLHHNSLNGYSSEILSQLLLPIYEMYFIEISCEKYWHSTISTIRFYEYSKFIEGRPKKGRGYWYKILFFLM